MLQLTRKSEPTSESQEKVRAKHLNSEAVAAFRSERYNDAISLFTEALCLSFFDAEVSGVCSSPFVAQLWIQPSHLFTQIAGPLMLNWSAMSPHSETSSLQHQSRHTEQPPRSTSRGGCDDERDRPMPRLLAVLAGNEDAVSHTIGTVCGGGDEHEED